MDVTQLQAVHVFRAIFFDFSFGVLLRSCGKLLPLHPLTTARGSGKKRLELRSGRKRWLIVASVPPEGGESSLRRWPRGRAETPRGGRTIEVQ
jgi:hypothetical protein